MKRITLTVSEETFARVATTGQNEQLTPVEVLEDFVEKAFDVPLEAMARAVADEFATRIAARQAA